MPPFLTPYTDSCSVLSVPAELAGPPELERPDAELAALSERRPRRGFSRGEVAGEVSGDPRASGFDAAGAGLGLRGGVAARAAGVVGLRGRG